MQPHVQLTVAKGQLLRILGLVLFFAMHSISAVFFLALDIPSEHLYYYVALYFVGVLCGALMLPGIERLTTQSGRAGTLWRAVLLAVMLAPALAYLSAPLTASGALAVNQGLAIFHPFFCALFLPLALRLFFHPVLAELHGFFFGLAFAVGHLCWALLTAMFITPEVALLPGTFDNAYLPFLKIMHCTFNAGFAIVVWNVMRHDAQSKSRQPLQMPPLRQQDAHMASTTALWPFLLPLFLCFLLNGLMGHTLFARLRMHGDHLEYMHLALAVFFLTTGFWVSSKGPGILRPLLGGSVLCVATAPLLFFVAPESTAHHLLYFAHFISSQAVIFSGTLVCGLLSLRCKHPALVACSVWLLSSASLLGCFFTNYAAPALSLPPFALVCIVAALCAFSAPLLYRMFSLPASLYSAPSLAKDGQDGKEDMAARLVEFAARYKLNEREQQIMEMLLQGHSTSEMAERMYLKENSIRTYTQHLLKKTGINSRRNLVIALLSPPGSPLVQDQADSVSTSTHPGHPVS